MSENRQLKLERKKKMQEEKLKLKADRKKASEKLKQLKPGECMKVYMYIASLVYLKHIFIFCEMMFEFFNVISIFFLVHFYLY